MTRFNYCKECGLGFGKDEHLTEIERTELFHIIVDHYTINHMEKLVFKMVTMMPIHVMPKLWEALVNE